MLKCENLPSTNSTISGAQYNFSKTSTPLVLVRLHKTIVLNETIFSVVSHVVASRRHRCFYCNSSLPF